MNPTLEFVVRTLLIGSGATLVMGAVLLAPARNFMPMGVKNEPFSLSPSRLESERD